jgi:cytochrome c oxidase subunit 2
MPIVVQAVEPEKFAQWLDEQKKKSAAAAEDPNKVWTIDELKARGEKVYTANCQVCHQPTGLGQPPVFPALSGSKVVNGPVADHIKLVLSGKNAMPTWKALSDTDLASVITFERNSWNNKTGDVVQPADVKKLR